MFRDLLDQAAILENAYREVAEASKPGQPIRADQLAAHNECLWCALRNVHLCDLADRYAERFFGWLSQLSTLEDILDRLDAIDPEYVKMIVSAELPEDEADTARTSAMCLLVKLFRRLEERGVVQMLSQAEVAAWLAEHAPVLGGKHGQLTLW